MGSSCGTSTARRRPTTKLFGVNPWRLQAWLEHKRIDETMLYVHVAEAHPRELPEHVQQAACTETDPDRRILSMLGARGKTVAKTQATETEVQPEIEVRAGGLEPRRDDSRRQRVACLADVSVS